MRRKSSTYSSMSCADMTTWVGMTLLLVLGAVFYLVGRQSASPPPPDTAPPSTSSSMPMLEYGGWWSDPFVNVYAPPLRPLEGQARVAMVPINVPTNIGAVDAAYRQVGLLTSVNGRSGPVPLMGRPVFANRDKWQYYTVSDQLNSVKLPLSRNGRTCTDEHGVDKLFAGDTVFVDGLRETYQVTLYDNDTVRYLPVV